MHSVLECSAILVRGASSVLGPATFFVWATLEIVSLPWTLLNLPNLIDCIRRSAFNVADLESWRLHFVSCSIFFSNYGDDEGNQEEKKGQRCGKARAGAVKNCMRPIQNYTRQLSAQPCSICRKQSEVLDFKMARLQFPVVQLESNRAADVLLRKCRI